MSTPSTLPRPPTTLIGRDQLVRSLTAMVDTTRLVTLTGPGGAGKTRVAIEVGRTVGETSAGGVFFVDLTRALAPDEVVGAFADGLGTAAPPGTAVEQHVVDHLGGSRCVLVVDNCEHLVDAVAGVVERLLAAAPGVRVLATSREALGLAGEQVVRVPSLDVEGVDSPAVDLFLTRARALDSGLRLDGLALRPVAELCRRLDGMPLALELAASRLRTLTPAQMLEHLDDRFRLLDGASRRGSGGHRTLEETIAWSYGLLDPEEQRVFRRLAVCAGGFTLPMAARLLGSDDVAAVGALDSLIGKSLLTTVEVGDALGYRMLETIRAYGRQMLEVAGEAEATHADLEAALLPAPGMLDDWTSLYNHYIVWGDDRVIESPTRRHAALTAQNAGRLDNAALILSSCLFPDEPGTFRTSEQMVLSLLAAPDELDARSLHVARCTKLLIEVGTLRYVEALQTALEALATLPPDHGARPIFDSWRCVISTGLAADFGLAETESAMPGVLARAEHPHDVAATLMHTTRALGLASLRRLPEASRAAADALTWARPGAPSFDFAAGMALWLSYLTGRPDPTLQALTADLDERDIGTSLFTTIAATMADGGPVAARGLRLVRLATRRPLGRFRREESEYLVAFAWLAFERGDNERALELVEPATIRSMHIGLALMHLLAAVEAWDENDWDARRESFSLRYVSPAQEIVADQGPAVLADEIARWQSAPSTESGDGSPPATSRPSPRDGAPRWRDRYEPLELLGSGGQGDVWRAFDHQHRRSVALKVRPAGRRDEHAALLAEARVLLTLRPHPNVPLVRDDFFIDDRYVLVMDWIEGTDLGRTLAEEGRPGLEVRTVLDHLDAVAEALDHLHAQTPPVIHGDIKPGNVIVRPDGTVVLVDFGIATTGGRSAAGSPGFRAPELGSGVVTPAADVYGLAATASTLLTGRSPAMGPLEWCGVDPKMVPRLERAIRRGLSTDPARRPASASELVRLLRSEA